MCALQSSRFERHCLRGSSSVPSLTCTHPEGQVALGCASEPLTRPFLPAVSCRHSPGVMKAWCPLHLSPQHLSPLSPHWKRRLCLDLSPFCYLSPIGSFLWFVCFLSVSPALLCASLNIRFSHPHHMCPTHPVRKAGQALALF